MIRNGRLSFFPFSALLLALLFLFAACAGEGKDPADAPAADESSADAGPEAALRIVENGTSTFAVVRADLASDAIVKSAINLKGKIV